MLFSILIFSLFKWFVQFVIIFLDLFFQFLFDSIQFHLDVIFIQFAIFIHNGTCYDAPVSSLMDSTASPKVNTTKGRVGAFSLIRTSGLEGCARAPRWGLGRLTSNSITHTDLHKPNTLQQKRGILRSKYHRKQQRKRFLKTHSCEPQFLANS
jgi:hypothetical protein